MTTPNAPRRMILDLHLLQNFSPSNLNRDDTGAPKTAQFAGTLRGMVSSQNFKRFIRELMRDMTLLRPEELSIRTRRVIDVLRDVLVERGHNQDNAARVASTALAGLGITPDSGNAARSSYLLFLGRREIGRLADVLEAHWDALLKAAPPLPEPDEDGEAAGANKGARNKAKKPAAGSGVTLPAGLTKALRGSLVLKERGGDVVDLALFGRMIANVTESNVSGALRVAPALSINRVTVESDFYTAVDDIARDDPGSAAAGMIGTVEFDSPCHYRYMSLDINLLHHNLAGDTELLLRALQALLYAMYGAVPSGKQTTFAAQPAPSLMLASVLTPHPITGHVMACNLSNAFADPIDGRNMIGRAISALGEHHALVRRKSAQPSEDHVLCLHPGADLGGMGTEADTIDELIAAVVERVRRHLDA